MATPVRTAELGDEEQAAVVPSVRRMAASPSFVRVICSLTILTHNELPQASTPNAERYVLLLVGSLTPPVSCGCQAISHGHGHSLVL